MTETSTLMVCDLEILSVMPVFYGTLVPVRNLFDKSLAVIPSGSSLRTLQV